MSLLGLRGAANRARRYQLDGRPGGRQGRKASDGKGEILSSCGDCTAGEQSEVSWKEPKIVGVSGCQEGNIRPPPASLLSGHGRGYRSLSYTRIHVCSIGPVSQPKDYQKNFLFRNEQIEEYKGPDDVAAPYTPCPSSRYCIDLHSVFFNSGLR
jgi:hypothetical protein